VCIISVYIALVGDAVYPYCVLKIWFRV